MPPSFIPLSLAGNHRHSTTNERVARSISCISKVPYIKLEQILSEFRLGFLNMGDWIDGGKTTVHHRCQIGTTAIVVNQTMYIYLARKPRISWPEVAADLGSGTKYDDSHPLQVERQISLIRVKYVR